MGKITAGVIAAAAAIELVFLSVFADFGQHLFDVGFGEFGAIQFFRLVTEVNVIEPGVRLPAFVKFGLAENFQTFGQSGLFVCGAGAVDTAAVASQAFNKNRTRNSSILKVVQFSFDIVNAGNLHHIGFGCRRVRLEGFNHSAFNGIGGSFFGFFRREDVKNAGFDSGGIDVFVFQPLPQGRRSSS